MSPGSGMVLARAGVRWPGQSLVYVSLTGLSDVQSTGCI